jgi:hypothetical protein
MNTKLTLLYRDSSNWKTSIKIIIVGELSSDQIKTIKNNLFLGEFIIANQVGLPTPSESDGESFNTEYSTIWTAIQEFETGIPTPKSLITHESPTVSLSVDELVSAMNGITWDQETENNRLGL